MRHSFNLVTAEWIPALPLDSRTSRLMSLDNVLEAAPRLRSLSATTPLATAGAYRLLLAILQAAVHPTEDDWPTYWAEPVNVLREGRRYLGKWAHRFDLFDTEHPFYQDPHFVGRPETVSSLYGHISSGADATLFNHTVQGSLTLPAHEAALAVLTAQAFGLAGTKGSAQSFLDAPSARGATLLIEGDNLAETLLLNLLDHNLPGHRLSYSKDDKPAWEMDDPFHSSAQRPYGLLDHLTWHNRRVRLIAESDTGGTQCVRQMIYGPGLRPGHEVFNPHYHWSANKEKKAGKTDSRSHAEVRFLSEKALWRDSAVLFSVRRSTDGADKPAAALAQAQQNVYDGILERARTYRLLAFGASTKSGQDKTFYYRHEALPLPLSLLDAEAGDAIGTLSAALRRADDSRSVLWHATNQMARLVLKPTIEERELAKPADNEAKKRFGALAQSWGVERQYWAELEPHFHRFVLRLVDAPEAALAEWTDRVRAAAQSGFARATTYVGADRRAMRAMALARTAFDIGLARALGKARPADHDEGEEADGSDGE